MSTRSDPSALRWLIGVQLTNIRKQATIRPQEVFDATGISKTKLSSMETGRYQQHPDDITTLLEFYACDSAAIDRLTSLAGLRPDDGPHTAETSGFVVLDFAQAQSVAYSEHLDGAIYVQDQDDVHTYKMAVDNLRSVALSPAKSLT
ncbi:MAG: Scr1 family TA system antitoxin-like transcriptional regulator [Sciscionella sp.]